ncbi:unnamed protein product [Commensalibacter communis]|uniref:siphovirus Gp157 family protein n=1 Tax=Commensalibacter communis TaxID=2972786 RepID=UPI0022FFB4D0|nr:siphovirus Gp157 family protein [Commensalibacter communis]CAI3953582.1 unnamed protein product [Commensalibacter communis]CAI3959199.1 unnamed protein product [Commensalibacter communis]
MVSIQEYIVETHNHYIKNAFNNYVQSITDKDASEEHRLLNAIYDLEFFIKCIEKCAEEFRLKLNQEMQDTGIISFKSDKATATLTKSVPSCLIISETELAKARPDLMIVPKPKPNKIEIAKLLRKGEQIPGTTLSNGGPPTLRIKAIQNKSNPYVKGAETNV